MCLERREKEDHSVTGTGVGAELGQGLEQSWLWVSEWGDLTKEEIVETDTEEQETF